MSKKFLAVIVVTGLLMGILTPFITTKAEASSLIFNVNGIEVSNNESLIINGRTYIPIRKFSELLNSTVIWNNELKQVSISKGNVSFNMTINEPKVVYQSETFFLDSPAIIKDSKSYAPVRFIAEALHYKVVWDSKNSSVNIVEKPTHIVKSGDTLALISQEYGISIDNLKTWNNLTDDTIYINQKLLLEPVVITGIDTVRTNAVIPYTEEELDLLARIIYSEARDEPYQGLVAVGAVVINRVQSPNFPNTIYNVIFQQSQFTPARTGKIYEVKPDEASHRAAKDAVTGADPVDGALYFFNPDISSSTFFQSKTHVADIGNHSFYR